MNNATTDSTAAAAVDRLGELSAAIATLQSEAKALKSQLQELIPPGAAADGELFRASHGLSERETVNWRKVAEYLEPSRQLVTAHTDHKSVHVIRVVARRTR